MNTKPTLAFAAVTLVALVLLGMFLLVRHRQEEHRIRMESVASQLEAILENGASVTVRPTPGNEIRELLTDTYGRALLKNLDEVQERLAFDPFTEAYVCIWSGLDDEQVMFVDPGTIPGSGLTAGMLSQITITKVQIKDGHATFWFTASSDAEDEEEVREIISLVPGERYRLAIKIADISETDLIQIWRSGTPLSTQQGGADQPATAPESKPEGAEEPEPESEVRRQ